MKRYQSLAIPRLTVEQADEGHVVEPVGTGSLHRLLVRGGSTLGVAVVLERVFGFLSNMLAARVAGPQTFGAYAVVLTTAGTVATYAGVGIGATATRFSGQYPRQSKGYPGFIRALILISLASALFALAVMVIGAEPLARFVLRNESLKTLLRLAALSAAALILLECCRGLLIGQQRFKALFILSVVTGLGLLLTLPNAARFSAAAMIGGHAGVALLAVLTCVLFARRFGLTPLPSRGNVEGLGPSTRSVLTFGLVQLSAVVGINIASWWLASLVVRADTTLAEMGVYAVANQFRGMASLGPGLFAQIGYPLLSDETGRSYGGPDRVMLINTFLTTTLTIVLAGLAMALLPWLLHLYGRSYLSSEIPATLLLATAIVHMGGAPSANRLSVVALRSVGLINAVWAVFMIVLGLLFVPSAGAKGAALSWLVAHVFSQILVLFALRYNNALPRGLALMSGAAIIVAVAFSCLAYARASKPVYFWPMTSALLLSLAVVLLLLVYYGHRRGWLPRTLSRAKS